jgi:pilus assembly protein CpaE
MRVLIIDPEQGYFRKIAADMAKAGYPLEYAASGKDGLAAIPAKNIEIAIINVHMPDLSGFEIIERLRRDPDYRDLPIIAITEKDELGEKLKAFDLGADDFMVKPLQLEELIARLGILARRGSALKFVRRLEADRQRYSTLIAVHSLRGGVGCTSLAVNLAMAFHEIWQKPTALVDAVLSSGQISMMLNAAPRVTLENYAAEHHVVDAALVEDLCNAHKTGIHYIAAPRFPMSADAFSHQFWPAVTQLMKQNEEFIVVDVPHDFSDSSIQLLTAADFVLLVVAPEMAALRAAVGALEIYDRLDFEPNKVKVVLNHSIQDARLKPNQLEKALGRPISFVLPYDAEAVVRGINLGEPFVLSDPGLAISSGLEDMAYSLSNELYKNIPPAVPSAAWKRVTGRATRPVRPAS